MSSLDEKNIKKIHFVKILAVNIFFLYFERERLKAYIPITRFDIAHALPIDFNENFKVHLIGQ